jgi:hypothetical protein
MDTFSFGDGSGHPADRHPPGDDAWAEALARTVAHLAAQLTVVQLRLRALATEVAAAGGVDQAAVAARLAELAATDGGRYLRENLGDALAEIIDVEALERDLIGFLTERP